MSFKQSSHSGSKHHRLLGLVVAVALLVAACGSDGADQSAPGDGVAGGQPTDSIAQLAFNHADGSQGQLADYLGQPLVVNFFAAWCPPCQAEMPDIEQVHQQAAGKVKVLGISHDFTEQDWQGLLDDTGVTFETVFQPDKEIFVELELFGMPSTIFISPEGEIVHTHTGILNSETLLSLISEHLSVEV